MPSIDKEKDTPPQCHGREMWAVKNRGQNELPYNAPIWWCPDCHNRLPREEAEAGQ
jgi:hypothetical protein